MLVESSNRCLKYFEAIREATDQCLAHDPNVYLMGLGVPDPKGVFGTTLGLAKKHGADRVLDMPAAENGMTGVAIGSALVGMRPIMVHQRMDFTLLAMEQLVNQAAKWHYMFGGNGKVPLCVRMIVGRGWGQGPQHAQSFQAWLAHIPGLKVVMPTTPHDAKGLLIASVEDDNPVIFIEHRWLHGISGHVPEEMYRVPIGKARVAREGKDITIACVSYMALEALRAADLLARMGVEAEVIDLRTIRPLDQETIIASVRKTGRLIVTDTGWTTCGVSAEITAMVAERALGALKAAPRRMALPDVPIPTTRALADLIYPRARDLARAVLEMMRRDAPDWPDLADDPSHGRLDVPDPGFTGPF
ncbi:MAG: alpha-ketoacid dehydrogenase subunit beta [Deltaproteobacteria bacterium]|nr:alpha-ketoacid dehydrogenase subunit beta [Deltaproteobacteria bacterium]